jgi:(E)-4-hydroxy-3-methylbut-2-enyl-diphosphate synthase
VRVNPGNYADKKKFEEIEYTDASYALELERIRQRFLPLVNLCKKHGTAMRIGTNHGSLSDRIMSRYGDTCFRNGGIGYGISSHLPRRGFPRDCAFYEVEQYASDGGSVSPTRFQMIAEKMDYPLHLGVTEAGEGEDGRIKSAVGIGTLLEDGLGDTDSGFPHRRPRV